MNRSIEWAFKMLLRGKKVRRDAWNRKVFLTPMNKGCPTIVLASGSFHPWKPSYKDIVTKDWEEARESAIG